MQTKRKKQFHRQATRRYVATVLVLTMLLAGLLMGAGRKTPVWHFPLSGVEWHVSDPYGARTDPFTGQETFHHGIDLACAEGTGVLAAQDGVVLTAACSESYGNYLCIVHPDGYETRYAHLQYLYARPGEVVQAGQLLGTVGRTGRATGPHLHLELWEQGTDRNPAVLLEHAP